MSTQNESLIAANATVLKDINFLLVTANVGSLFENLAVFEKLWIDELLKVIEDNRAHIVALHCQEIGGKHYKKDFEPAVKFFEKLYDLKSLEDFTVVQSFIDGQCDNFNQFSALGNVYLVHKSVANPEIFNFETEKFVKVNEKKLFSDRDIPFSCAHKERFDQDFIREWKWSRKGYIRVRWKINDTDRDNIKAAGQTPSRYAICRKKAMDYVMNKFQTEYPLADDALQFVFGDFNFRLDVKSLIQGIYPTLRQQIVRSPTKDVDDEVIRMVYHSSEKEDGDASDDDVVVTLEEKSFQIKHKDFQPTTHPEKLRCYDIEFPSKDIELKEYEVTFPPTYPCSENLSEPNDYMKTRCPSWCDRILLSTPTWDRMHSLVKEADVTYDVIGKTACMGDHKPVYLAFIAPLTDEKEKSILTQKNANKEAL